MPLFDLFYCDAKLFLSVRSYFISRIMKRLIIESAKGVPTKGVRDIVLLPEARRRAEDRCAKSLVGGGTGRGAGPAGPQRRRQDYDDEDYHRRGGADEG